MPRGRPSSKSTSKANGSSAGKEKVKEEKVSVVDIDDGSDKEEEEDRDGAVEEKPDTGLPKPPEPTLSKKKVIVAPKEIREFGWKDIMEFHFKHPRTGVSSLFLLNTGNTGESSDKLVYEVLTMQQETRSWFVDNSIVSDGNIYVCTQVDPLFLVLPTLIQSGQAKPIADHMCESSLPRMVAEAFGKRIPHEELQNIANKKVLDDIVAFGYSEDKTISWLENKAEKVAKFLMNKGISLTESSISSNFVKSSEDSVAKQDCLRYACDIVGEYIDESLKRKLLEKLNLPVVTEKAGIKRKNQAESDDESTNKKTKVDGDNVPLEDYGSNISTPNANKAKVTAREKVLQKAAQGSHSLFKFFAPKAK